MVRYITKLKGPWRGTWFDLYVIMLDIFSRKAMHREVHVAENASLAAAFIENAITTLRREPGGELLQHLSMAVVLVIAAALTPARS